MSLLGFPWLAAQEFYIFAVSSLVWERRMAEMSPLSPPDSQGLVQAWGGMRAESARAPKPSTQNPFVILWEWGGHSQGLFYPF